MRSCVAVAIACALLSVSSAARSSEIVAAPYELVRTLQRVQDRITSGSVRAHKAQRKLLRHISASFANADSAAWREPRNARAVVIFLLSGGDPKVGRKIYASGFEDEEVRDLVRAALAYAEKRRGEALKVLRNVDPIALPASLGGHVALVKSALYQNFDLKKAIAYLDIARLLMPGTLIEEAALRRGVVAAGNDGDLEKFEFLAAQYVNRFSTSIYIDDFSAKFAQHLVALSYLEMPGRKLKVERMLARLASSRRRNLYLTIARRAVIAGKTEYALFAAAQAEALSPRHSPEFVQARAYKAAAAVVTDDPTAAMKQLRSLDVSVLSRADRQVVQAALALSEHLTRRLMSENNKQMRSPHAPSNVQPSNKASGPKMNGVAARAEMLIDVVDDLLIGNNK